MRTSIAIVALGFVVARFGLLIHELGPQAPRHTPVGLSTGFGVALVACGAILVLVAATRRYRQAARAIEQNTYQPSPGLILLLTAGFVFVAVLLIAYLLASA